MTSNHIKSKMLKMCKKIFSLKQVFLRVILGWDFCDHVSNPKADVASNFINTIDVKIDDFPIALCITQFFLL